MTRRPVRLPSAGSPASEAALDAAARRRSPAMLGRHVAAYLNNLDALEVAERIERLRRTARLYDTHAAAFAQPLSHETAVGYARGAVAAVGSGATTDQRIRALDTLGNVLFQQGLRSAKHHSLCEAETHLRAALSLIDRRAAPATWCAVATTLAGVPSARYQRDTARDDQAAAARALYRRVRSVAARAKLTEIWVDAATNILRMERDEADGRKDAVALGAVLHRIRRVLRTFAARTGSTPSAALRHLLAVALCMRCDIHYSRADLEEARALWIANCEEWPRERSEQEWARFANSIAVVDMTIGERDASLQAVQAAAALLSTIADFPSQRPFRPRGAPKPPWRLATTPVRYCDALINMAGVRDALATMTQSPVPIYDTIADLEDIAQRRSDVGASYAASLKDLRARAAIALARMIPQRRRHRDDAIALSHEAADALRATGQPGVAASLLTTLGEVLLQLAHWPDTRATLALAEATLRAAHADAGPDETSDIATTAWRHLTDTRLRLAAWDRDSDAANRLLAAVEAYRRRLGTALAPVQDLLLDGLAMDCRSVVARLKADKGGFVALTTDLARFVDRPDLPAVLALRYQVGLGHAQKAAGRPDDAIATWARAQDSLRSIVAATGDARLTGSVTCAVGRAGRELTAGGGLSLADELATALIRRGQPGDIDRALLAVERGRALSLSLRAGPDETGTALHHALREADGLERRYAAEALAGSGDGVRLSRLGHRRHGLRAARREDAARADAAAPPAIDHEAVAAALPDATSVALVVVAEQDGALVLLGRDGKGQAARHVVPLDGFGRAAIDRLLLGTAAPAGGLLDAIDALQALSEGAVPSAATFDRAIGRFSRAVEACDAWLAPRLIDPACEAIGKTFGAAVARLCWLLPGALWPLPLHAMRATEGTMPAVQSYGRTLSEVAALSQRRRHPTASPRRVLVVDDPGADMQAPCPFPNEANGLRWRHLRGRGATRAAILKGIADTDVFLFHGHGRYVRGDRDQSGLILATRVVRAARPSKPAPPAVLSIDAIHALHIGARDLAVLSACDVGGIDLHADVEDFSGLPAELLDAGFSSVVAATWPVEQRATAALMRELIVAFATSADPAAALALAQARIRSQGSIVGTATQRVGAARVPAVGAGAAADMAAVYWWAGFRLIGL